MNFQQPVRPVKPPTEPKTGLRGFIETIAEKDELLLYFTAFLGVVMPGIVYLIYRRVHIVYQRYAEKKEVERLEEERAKAEITIIYASAQENGGKAKERAEELFEAMSSENPKVYDLGKIGPSVLTKFKGFVIFIVENLESTRKADWLLDWLEDIAADKKLKKNTNVEEIKFVALGFKAGKTVVTLNKRMKIVGAKELRNCVDLGEELGVDDENKLFNQWAMEAMEAIDVYFQGEHESILGDESMSEMSDLDGDESKKER